MRPLASRAVPSKRGFSQSPTPPAPAHRRQLVAGWPSLQPPPLSPPLPSPPPGKPGSGALARGFDSASGSASLPERVAIKGTRPSSGLPRRGLDTEAPGLPLGPAASGPRRTAGLARPAAPSPAALNLALPPPPTLKAAARN